MRTVQVCCETAGRFFPEPAYMFSNSRALLLRACVRVLKQPGASPPSLRTGSQTAGRFFPRAVHGKRESQQSNHEPIDRALPAGGFNAPRPRLAREDREIRGGFPGEASYGMRRPNVAGCFELLLADQSVLPAGGERQFSDPRNCRLAGRNCPIDAERPPTPSPGRRPRPGGRGHVNRGKSRRAGRRSRDVERQSLSRISGSGPRPAPSGHFSRRAIPVPRGVSATAGDPVGDRTVWLAADREASLGAASIATVAATTQRRR